MDSEKAIRIWAGNRLGINQDSIKNVEFGYETGGYCPTCEYTMAGVEVSHINSKGKLTHSFIDLGYESFANILNEILEVGE
jgi:hypothetical protein